jgi:hypothetical protein
MLHPDTELRFISDTVGYGVVATRLIPKGTITWAGDVLDQRFSPENVKRMSPKIKAIVDKYTFRDRTGEYVLCWDHARFINHSFNANCITTAYDFELAIRDIQPGEELTDDYGFLNIDEPFDCVPEKGTTRTRVRPDDLLRSYKKWDTLLLDSFSQFAKVDQPLAHLLSKETLKKAKAISAGKAEMDSIINCFYDGRSARPHRLNRNGSRVTSGAESR